MSTNIEVINNKHIITDIVQGDMQLTNNKLFQELTYKEIQEALNLIVNNNNLTDTKKQSVINNLWRLNFEVKPPTMAEFLTPKYLGNTADTIYDHVRSDLIKFMNPLGNKRVLAFSSAIGWGKSTASTLLVLYIMITLSYLRNPKKYFNLGEMGSIVAVLMSFTLKKANQSLLQPFYNALKSSPILHMTRTEEGLIKKQQEIPYGHIAYTSAGRLGNFQFSKDLHIAVLSDRANLLGLNIIAGIASEISYWIEKGVNIDEIWGTFTDLRERINSRFAGAYLTATILDSSPLDLELSPIDKWLYTGEAEKDPEVMFVNAKHWDVFPEKYPRWRKTGETFPTFRGNASKPPKIIIEEERKDYAPDDIYDIPIDKHQSFINNIKKQMRDYCAYPSGGLSKLFENFNSIDNIFHASLKNQYVPIIIPEEKNPENLIWEQIRDKFFICLGNNHYEFYRSPMAIRTVHIDLSEVGDISGVGMSHKEYNLKGEEIIIHDFLIPLHKGESRINLDAVCDFIIDLRNKGNINLYKVTADKYQSSAILQRMRRGNIDAQLLSVDKETTPYLLYASWVKSGRVKAGRSIHLKNNLKSLMETRRESGSLKIDHIQGEPIYEDNRSWKSSQVGFGAKDISDVSCGSAYILITEYKGKPKYTFDETYSEEDTEKRTENILKALHTKYSLKPRDKYL